MLPFFPNFQGSKLYYYNNPDSFQTGVKNWVQWQYRVGPFFKQSVGYTGEKKSILLISFSVCSSFTNIRKKTFSICHVVLVLYFSIFSLFSLFQHSGSFQGISGHWPSFANRVRS